MNNSLGQKRATRHALSILVFIGLISICVQAQSAQTYSESVAYDFRGIPDGLQPQLGLVQDSSGNLYGGTSFGGEYGLGSVFELTPNGSGGYTYKQMFSLNGGPGGSFIQGLTIDNQGNLYGWTSSGGSGYSYGNVFELSLGSEGWVMSNAYAFTGLNDGMDPTGVVVDSAGNVYGTTHISYEPQLQYGTFFELTTNNNQWFEQTLFGFNGAHDTKYGEYPAALATDKKGNFYGTASGDDYSPSVIFKLHDSAQRGWVGTVFQSFPPNVGGLPSGSLTFGTDGNLYAGTTTGGLGYGGVYKLTPSGKMTWLYSFTDGADGWGAGDVTFDKAGNLYGITGGTGYGSIFKLTRPSSGQTTWTENVLYTFSDGADGGGPAGALVVDDAGNVYGTTAYGGLSYGQYGAGVVFKLTPNPVATTTIITKNSPNPSLAGEVVTVSFTVAQTVLANSKPTGTVTVNASTGESCLAVLPANGKASCKLLFATAGTRTLTATYSGDAVDLASVSGAVNQSTSNTTNSSITGHAPDPAKVGRPVNVEFSVDAKNATKQTRPTGSVTVNASSGQSCTGTLSASGNGKCQLTFGSSEITALTATYAGDANNKGSVSKSVEQAVE
jgi:uncharacterized repeat protein (TIGR03803 family)